MGSRPIISATGSPNDEYRRRAIELLNVCLKEYAWRRWLRFDGVKGRYFFSPKDGKPKRTWRRGCYNPVGPMLLVVSPNGETMSFGEHSLTRTLVR
jgi:hypothetical protein